MKGFYVYCIREAGKKKIKMKGVEFAKSIKVFPCKDIEAIVGELNPAKFAGAKLKNKLVDDPKWAEENIRRHHEVISQVFQASVVIPMKFGMMFKTKKSLDEMLAKYYWKFKNLIRQLANKKEWGVKAHLDHKKFIEGLKKNNKEIQKLETRRSSIQEGMRWYVERKTDKIIANELEEAAEKELRYFIEELEKHVEKMRLNETPAINIQSSAMEMIMNAACLVKNNALQDFKNLFQELAKEATQRGMMLELTGPWPPYNFVEINHEKT